MRVLLLEPESENRLKLRRLLEPEGHEVLAPADAERAIALLRGRPPELVICVIEPGQSEGARFIERSRGLCNGAAGLLMSAFHSLEDSEISAAMLSFARADFLPKSATVQELSETLRRLVRAPVRLAAPEQRGTRPMPATTVLPERARPTARPEPTAARIDPARPQGHSGAVDQRNLRTLARLWVTRATGTVCLSNGPGGAEGWASIRDGGVVDEESRRLLDAGLSGGELLFEAVDVISTGDREIMGHLLWTAARAGQQGSFAQNSRFQALTRTSSTNASAHLPLAAATRKLVAMADGHIPLGQAMAGEGIDPESVSLDLYALVQLGLLTLQTPIGPLARPSPVQASVEHGLSGTATLPRREGDPLSRTTSDLLRRRPGAPAPTGGGSSPLWAGRAEVGGAQGQVVPPVRTGSTMTSRTVGSSGSALRGRAPLDVRGGLPSMTSHTGSALEVSHARAHIGPVLKRLQREAGDLRSASPAVVLGLPPDTSSDLVRQHVERLRERYTGLAADASLPQEARELAGQILERIEDAAKNFGKVRHAAAAAAMDEQRLLTMGRELIGRQQWDQAEKVLERARHLKADNASVLANLGWVRLNNPAHDREARARDAREMLFLSEQFDPNNAEGQRYLAELLYKLGEYKAALPRAERAQKASPENTAVATLLRKLRARLAAQS